MRRLVAAAGAALLLLVALAATASAHPLGNYTVNRAVVVTVAPGKVAVTYLVDMAEIPAFNEIAAIDTDGDGLTSAAEQGTYATSACANVLGDLELTLDGRTVALVSAGAAGLSFPEGAGQLHTLRLECQLSAEWPASGSGVLQIADRANDGHVGWHEVIIRADGGARITAADVPAASDSAFLTAYPADRLQTPPDVRQGSATFEFAGGTAGAAPAPSSPNAAATANDPLAALVGGELSPALVALALLLAAGLGAAHAISPGHGKTLVAAYLVGSRGTIRQAAALGLAVAATHTAGVLVLGVLVLLGGELFLPERIIGWLTVVSGAMMAALGAALIWRATQRRRGSSHSHPHPHEHPHTHPHPHRQPIEPALTVRGAALLGMAGGMVPSASALIVLLAAVTTGRLVFGLALIGAFGAGMALVLGGIAVVTTVAHGWLSRRLGSARPRLLTWLGGLVPVGSGMVVAGVGVVLTLTAVSRLG
jgi:ABC-type nickel/cobalt efflux system permease component RcnA